MTFKARGDHILFRTIELPFFWCFDSPLYLVWNNSSNGVRKSSREYEAEMPATSFEAM